MDTRYVYTGIASIMVEAEEYFHSIARARSRRITGSVPEPPKILVPKLDRARVVAVFLDKGMVHIVWDDEYVPFPAIDDAYRRIRCLKYGRTADVETVIIRGGMASFPYTFAEPQPYEASLHFDSSLGYRGAIFSWTWNHMLSTRPSPWVMIRGGYRVEKNYEIKKGTRDDADDYARSLGC